MNVEIKSTNENPLLKRKEITFAVKDAKITPSRKDLRAKIASLTNTDEKNLVVDVFETRFGTDEFSGKARIYANPEELKKTELKPMRVRNFGKEEEKKPAAAAKENAAPAETPAKK